MNTSASLRAAYFWAETLTPSWSVEARKALEIIERTGRVTGGGLRKKLMDKAAELCYIECLGEREWGEA